MKSGRRLVRMLVKSSDFRVACFQCFGRSWFQVDKATFALVEVTHTSRHGGRCLGLVQTPFGLDPFSDLTY